MVNSSEQDFLRALIARFLNAHEERIADELSERLRKAGEAVFLPIHRALFDLVRAHAREASPHRTAEAVRRMLTEAGYLHDAQPIISGQVALWITLHRMLRENLWEFTKSPEFLRFIDEAFALTGDIVDGILGALIDIARTGDAPVGFLGWGMLVESGRTHREFRMLNQVIHDLLNAREPADMFEVLEQGILGTFHIRSLLVATVNQEGGFLEIVRSYPANAVTRDPIGWRYDLSHPEILCEVARTGRAEVIDGWDPRYHERIIQADGRVTFRQRQRDFNAGHTAFFVPILVKGQAIGVIATGSTQRSKQIVLSEIERMRPFLDQVGMVISIGSEIAERKQAEEALRKAHDELEVRVQERTAELAKANETLQIEIAGRKKVEKALRKAHEGLEQRIQERTLELSNAVALLEREIVDRQQIEEDLRKANEALRSLFQASPAAIVVVDPNNNVKAWNPGAERIFGWSSAEVMDRPLPIIPEDQRDEYNVLSAGELKGEMRSGLELRRLRKDGSLIDVSLWTSPLRDVKGEFYGTMGLFVDITDHKRAEKAIQEAERTRVLVETAGAAAHEIYQPLTAIIGFAQVLLLNMEPGDPRRKNLKAIERAGKEIHRIVDKMLSLQQYATKPYINGIQIVDLDAASQKGIEDRET